jgi:hypothetical protein
VAALERCARRREGGPRVALAREQTVFRIRTLAAGHRDAAAGAEARAGYLEGRAREARRGVARARVRRRVAALAALTVALAAGALGTAAAWGPRGGLAVALALALVATGAVVVATIAGRPADPAALAARGAEAARLLDGAALERRAADAEHEAARRLGRLEARLQRPPAEGHPDGAGEPGLSL